MLISNSIYIDSKRVRVVNNKKNSEEEITAIELIRIAMQAFIAEKEITGLILIDYPTPDDSPFIFVDIEKQYQEEMKQIILSCIKDAKEKKP